MRRSITLLAALASMSVVGCVSQSTAKRQEIDDLVARLDTISCNELAVALQETHYRTTKIAIARLQITKGCEATAIYAIEEDDRRFQRRTPLWYYILREAKVQKNGDSLGAVGSRVVAETLIGFLKHDPNSFLNNRYHARVTAGGIKVPGRFQPVGSLADMIDYVGLQK